MKEFALLDTCYPDYFTGYHRPVLAIPVFNHMTFDEVAESLEYELNSSWEYLTNESNGFSKTEILIIEEYIQELLKTPYEFFIGQNEFEENEYNDETAYAYFSIIKPVYKYGMKFLNE